MPLFTHVLWFISYIIIAVFVSVTLNKGVGVEILTASVIGGVIFLVLTQIHAAFARRRERRETQERLMALYRDYQSALDAVDDTRDAMASLEDHIQKLELDRRPDVIAEMRILQTLLAQVVSKSSRAAAETAALKPDPAYAQAVTAEIPAADDSSAQARPKVDMATAATRREDAGDSHDELLNIMHNALEENRVDLYLQPIVTLPSRRVSHYEAFSRVRDEKGRVIFPREYLPVAEESGLIGTLDNLLLFRCIQTIRRLGHRRPGIKFFCNISPSSLEDEEFFPQFIDFMLNNPELTGRLVFEFAEADLLRQSRDVRERLDALGRQGFAFSMDRVSDVRFNFVELAERHIRFVKIDAASLVSRSYDIRSEDIKDAFKKFEIELIVEKIEEEKTLLDILDLGVAYGQGYLFGEPRLSREPSEGDIGA